MARGAHRRNCQITKLDFAITRLVDVNGVGRGKKRFLDHLQIGHVGGTPMPTSKVTTENQGPPGLQPGMAARIILEFNKADSGSDTHELKQLLRRCGFRSSGRLRVQWFEYANRGR